MIDVVTWLWHDPLLEGSRGSRQYVPVDGASIRPDLLMNGRRRKRLAMSGRAVPQEHSLPQRVVYGAPQAPRFFNPEFVNRLAQLFKQFLPVEHRFVCFADDPEGFSADVCWMQTPPAALELRKLRSPEGNRFPSCFSRLWGWSSEAAKHLNKFLLVDIDMIPVNDLTPIAIRPEPVIGWRPFRDWGRKLRIGGGIYLCTPGVYAHVWDDFVKNPHAAIAAARSAGFRGSDQAWLSHKLAHKIPIYGRSSGIYSIRDLGHDHALPRDARLVQFNGPQKPWNYTGRGAWVARYWKGG